MTKKLLMFLALNTILAFSGSTYGNPSDSSSATCILTKLLSKREPVILQVLDPDHDELFSGKLESVSAEVQKYIHWDATPYKIEHMKLTDTVTGISVDFSHNRNCVWNECPTEEAEIEVGTVNLDLGPRGKFRLECDYR